MKKMKYLLPGALIMLPMIAFADSDNNEYLSDWWHQSINIVGSNSLALGHKKGPISIQNTVRGHMWIGLIFTAMRIYLNFLVWEMTTTLVFGTMARHSLQK